MILRELRKAANLTQQELADAVGVDRISIARYEKGIREPSAQMLITFASFFKVSVDYLLGFQSQKQTPDPQTAEEYELLTHFRKLSASARELALQTLRLYASNPLMLRPTPLVKQAT